MDMSLSKFQEMIKYREAWHAAVHRVTKELDVNCIIIKDLIHIISECFSGFPYFLQFKSEFSNKGFMI